VKHPAVEHILQFFEYEHLPDGLRMPSTACRLVAHNMAANLPHNPELTAGLRKLLEAKDCFVRAMLAKKNEDEMVSEKVVRANWERVFGGSNRLCDCDECCRQLKVEPYVSADGRKGYKLLEDLDLRACHGPM